MVAESAFLGDFAPPANHHISDHGKADSHQPPGAFFKTKKAFHIGHAADGQRQNGQRADQRPG